MKTKVLFISFVLLVLSSAEIPAADTAAKAANTQKTELKDKSEQKNLSSADIISKLQAWDEKLNTISMDFTQEVYFKEADLRQEVSGSMQYAKPNHLRIEHIKPSKQIIVTDKQQITIYKPEDKQVINASWDGWLKTQSQSFYGVLDFGNYSTLTNNNNTQVSGGEDGKPYIITLTPKHGTKYILKLTLSSKDFFPTEAALEVGSAVTTTKIIKAVKNAAIDEAIFKLDIPAKTEIINLNK